MKSIYILTAAFLMMAFYSCKKCKTCIPYYVYNGHEAVDRQQHLKVCDKVWLDAFEHGHFADRYDSAMYYVCN